MQMLLALLTLLTGLSIVLLPLATGFFPKLGLTPLKLGHRRATRFVQVLLLWSLAGTALWIGRTAWGWTAAGTALWFTGIALNFFPQRIFVDLTQPERAQNGLADSALVLAAEVDGEVVAYPLELIVPHHIVNDIIGGKPVLVAW